MKTKLRKIYHPGGKVGNIIIRLAIVILTMIFLYEQLFHEKDLESISNYFKEVSGKPNIYLLLAITICLIPLNIVIESLKWKLLIDKLEKVSLYNSVKAVLAGNSVSMIMPNRVGDYLGRVFVLKKADRFQAVLSTILGSIAQLLTTIVLGLTGAILYFPEYFIISSTLNMWMYIGVIMVVIAVIALLILSYLNFSVFSIIVKRISGKYYTRIKKYAEVFSWYSQRELMSVLLLSVSRYIVFSLQFYLLLMVFDIKLGYFVAMMLISVVYLVMAVIPTIALTEIGVRGSVSLYIFQQHFEVTGTWNQGMELGIVSASTVLWFFNIVFPAFLGAGFVFTLRFFRKINGN